MASGVSPDDATRVDGVFTRPRRLERVDASGASARTTPYARRCCVAYEATLLVCFGSSTLYHGHFSNPKMFHFWMRVTQRLFLHFSELQVRVDGVGATSRHCYAVAAAA